MNNYILVDTENVSNYDVIRDFINDNEKYNIVLFKSNSSQSIKAKYWDVLFKENINTNMITIVGTGKQNMDIQMAGYIGYLMKRNYETIKVFIVSDDNHFSNLLEFFKSLNEKLDIIHIKNKGKNADKCLTKVKCGGK